MKKIKAQVIRICLCICWLVSLSLPVFAQNGLTQNAGARGLAMGNATVTFQDVNSIFSNQAGLSFVEQTGVALFSEQRFAISEIQSIAAGFVYPTSSGIFGIQIEYYGFEDYNEQKVGLAYSRKLLEKLALGAQINYINFRIPEYGNKGFLSFELGLQSEILEGLVLGFHIANPIGQELVIDEDLPTVFKLGASYSPSEKVILSVEAEKDIDFETRIKGGIEYKLIDAFAIRVGFASNPGAFSFGAGYAIKQQLKIDVGASYHQILGFSPGLSVLYLFEK